MNNYKISLLNYIEKDQKGLVGRPEGEKLLEELKKKNIILKEIEVNYDKIEIIIPSQIKLLNKSYFLGFLETRVQELGKKNFLDKYKFITDREKVLSSINDFVDFALLTSTQEDILDV